MHAQKVSHKILNDACSWMHQSPRRALNELVLAAALTAHEAIAKEHVGKIDIFDHVAYVAVERSVRKVALRLLGEGKVKGRRFKARAIG